VALVGVAIIGGLADTSVRGWIANAFVLPALGVPVQACDLGTCTTGYALAPAWTIGVQLSFFAFLPFYDRLVRRVFPSGNRRHLLLGAAALYVIGAATRAVLVLADPAWSRRATFTLPLWLDVFALGLMLTVMAAPRPSSRAGNVAEAAAGTDPWRSSLDHWARAVWPWWLAAGALVFLGTRVSPPADPFGLGTEGASVRVACFGLAATLALIPGIFGDQHTGLLRRLLSSGPLRWLGMISLSFYLWHLPILEKVKEWIVPGYPALRSAAASVGPDNPLGALVVFTGSFWRVTLLTFVVTTIVASFAYLFVERPAARWRAAPRDVGPTPVHDPQPSETA
jgi:peptidoglycan/LPS O-acetylase OafA/YrhL